MQGVFGNSELIQGVPNASRQSVPRSPQNQRRHRNDFQNAETEQDALERSEGDEDVCDQKGERTE